MHLLSPINLTLSTCCVQRVMKLGNMKTRLFTTRPPIVDMHTHFLPAACPNFKERHGGDGWPWVRHTGPLPDGTFGYNRGCSGMLMQGEEDFRPITQACWDVQSRLDDMDAAGIELQLISATPILFQ